MHVPVFRHHPVHTFLYKYILFRTRWIVFMSYVWWYLPNWKHYMTTSCTHRQLKITFTSNSMQCNAMQCYAMAWTSSAGFWSHEYFTVTFALNSHFSFLLISLMVDTIEIAAWKRWVGWSMIDAKPVDLRRVFRVLLSISLLYLCFLLFCERW